MSDDDWLPIKTKPPFQKCEERGLYTNNGDGLFYFKATHWRPIMDRQTSYSDLEIKQRYKRALEFIRAVSIDSIGIGRPLDENSLQGRLAEIYREASRALVLLDLPDDPHDRRNQ